MNTVKSIPDIFGELVFNDEVMKKRLKSETYEALLRIAHSGEELPRAVADEVAHAMKEWALEKGATHYTHWFQPMTGITAEKHDSFISPAGKSGIEMRFSGKELIKGEPDASSFPSGGLRSTFEARGYTVWDMSSHAFIKDGTLCIPTAFISYSGQVLDKKTPLLRSMRVLENQVKRVLCALGEPTDRVNITVGAEQEYFLVDREKYLQRKDLIFTGRTLFGAKPPKGQELEDHYFGSIKPRVMEYMQRLDAELWRLGIFAKTRHNETAPSQHELAPVFTEVNVASDHNQLTMEVMQKIAGELGLVCLLHEKPFDGVNGSGKHNNWSISTAEGVNLLEPGKNPQTNLRFLLFLSAVIAAADKHSDLLRLSVASASNDLRLGGFEAPPAIISMFLGSELTEILESYAEDKAYRSKDSSMLKADQSVPEFLKDTVDRNRTSPLAFTGNKFEFRMLGSSFNIACTNVMFNTTVADALCGFADVLEKASDKKACVKGLIRDNYLAHKRIIFNGNGYTEQWIAEAERRGLLNLACTPEALECYATPKNFELFARHGIYTPEEISARQDILLENYYKVVTIEALTLADMTDKQLVPFGLAYAKFLAKSIEARKSIGQSPKELLEFRLLEKIDGLLRDVNALCEDLKQKSGCAKKETVKQCARYARDVLRPALRALRKKLDELEPLVPKKYWTLPTYADLLFST